MTNFLKQHRTAFIIILILILMIGIIYLPAIPSYYQKHHPSAKIDIYEINKYYQHIGIRNCGSKGNALLYYIADNSLYLSNDKNSFNDEPLLEDVTMADITTNENGDTIICALSVFGKMQTYLYSEGKAKPVDDYSDRIPDQENIYLCTALRNVVCAVSENYLLYDNGTDQIVLNLKDLMENDTRISKLIASEMCVALLSSDGNFCYLDMENDSCIKRTNIADICLKGEIYCYTIDKNGMAEIIPKGSEYDLNCTDGTPQKIEAGDYSPVALSSGELYGYKGNFSGRFGLIMDNFPSIIEKNNLEHIDDFYVTQDRDTVLLICNDKAYVVS